MLLVTLIGLLIREVKQAKLEAEKRRLENEKAHFDRVFKLIYAVQRASFKIAAQTVCPYCDDELFNFHGYQSEVVKVPRRDIHPPPMGIEPKVSPTNSDKKITEDELKAWRAKREAEIAAVVKAMRDPTNPDAYHYVHQRPGCSDQHECAAEKIHWLIESVPA
jgi:hypothetical protein